MVEIGIAEYFDMGAALGIIGTMFVVLYYSRKQAQGLSADIETKILNDLDEKVRKMSEIIIEKPSMQKVIYKLEKPEEDLAFAYYILFICSHVYAMRQREVLDDHEWTRWLLWMRNCFKYGTIGEQWKRVQSERWFSADFENFINAMSLYSAPFSVELNTTYWIIALYSLARSSFNPLIISSLVEDDAASASSMHDNIIKYNMADM